MLMDTKPIHIYKASAGAGKTFTLAAEFIANLINDYRLGDQPTATSWPSPSRERRPPK